MKWINFKEKGLLLASMTASRIINANRNPSKLHYERILFIKPDEIGDMCYSTHAFQMVRRQYPQAVIFLLCKSYGKALMQSNPDIDHLITSWDELNGRFDLIIDIRTSWKSIFYALKNCPKTRLDRGTVRLLDAAKGDYPHEVITNFRVVQPLILENNQSVKPYLALNDDDKATADRFISVHHLTNFALLHISARRELRKWPLRNFCKLAEHLLEAHHLSTVFIGDESEADEIKKAQQLIAIPTYNAAGILSLTQLAALMEKATIYIGNESGPLHMAAIMQLPCLGLYGPGPRDIFYPYGAKTRVIHHVLECNPCDQIHCVHPDNPCIQRITMDEVKDKIRELLNQ